MARWSPAALALAHMPKPLPLAGRSVGAAELGTPDPPAKVTRATSVRAVVATWLEGNVLLTPRSHSQAVPPPPPTQRRVSPPRSKRNGIEVPEPTSTLR